MARKTLTPALGGNCTGPDRTLDFTRAESVVVKDEQRVLALSSTHSTMVVIAWNLQT
ncbi:MAG: hypothetical protein ABI945_01470 [Nitrospirales bacterium]